MVTKKILSKRNRPNDTVSALLESLPDAVYIMEPDGVILNTNTLFASQFGRQPQECVGTNVYDLIETVLKLPELSIYLKEKSEEVLRSGKRLHFSNERDIRKVTISPLLLPESESTRLIITIQNIAEQKFAEKELQKERALKTVLLDAIPCSAIILDSDLRMIVWNRYAQDMLFSSPEAGTPSLQAVKFFHPDDMALLREKFRNTMTSGIEDYSEIKVHPQGSSQPLWLMTRTRKVIIDGKPCAVSIGIDITERKQIEIELQKNKMMFNQALESARAGVWERELKTNMLFWSDTMWALFGLDRDNHEASFENWSKVVHPEDLEKTIKEANEASSKGCEINLEYRVCHPDGSVHWFMTRGKPLFDEEGHATHYIGTIIDISNQKLKERELHESKMRFNYALDAANSGIWEWEVTTDTLSWSKQMWKLYGLEVNSLPLNNQLCVDTIHPDDREMASWIIRDALSKGTAASLEYRTVHPDGSIHWLTSRGMPLRNADGKITRYIGTIIDITERKQIETELIESRKKLSQALEAAHAGVWEWDLKTNKNTCSEEIWSLFGMKRGDEKISFDLWTDSVHPDDRESTLNAVTTAAKSSSELNVEYRVCHPDGSIHWLMARGKPQKNEKGKTIRYIGTIIDITDQKSTEQELTVSKKRLTFALEATNTGVWEWNVNTDNVIWTDNVWKLYGLEQNSMPHTHKLCESNIYPDDRDLTFEKVMAAASKEIEINIEYRVKHQDGSVHWLMCRGVPTCNADGQLHCYIGTVTDITSRKELLNDLYVSKTRLTQALEAARAGVWEWNLNTGENIWSDETWLLYGLNKVDRKPSFELWTTTIHPDDREMTIRAVSIAAENEIELNVEYRIFHANGSVHWLMSRGKPLYDKYGQADRYIGTIIDITGKKEAEEKFRKSQERLDFVLERSHVGVWDLNLQEGTTERTLEHAHIFGYETIPPVWSLEKFFDHVISDDRARIQTIIENSIEKKTNYSFECRIHTVNDELRWIWVNGAFQPDQNGKSSHILGLIQDITGLKKAEAEIRESELKFRNIFDYSPVAIGIGDLSAGILHDVNNAWLKLFGYTREEVIGKNLRDLGLFAQIEDHEKIVSELNEHRKILNTPFHLRKKSGETATILFSSEFISLNDKPALLVIMTDITLQELQQLSIERLEQAVTDRTEQLNQEVKRLNSFLNMISHEYRTPLAIIRGNLDLIELKNKHLNCCNPVEMNKIRRAINRLVEVMEESLHESRVFESRTTLSLKPFPIAPVIASQIESIRALWPERTIHYSEKLEECEIFGDPSQLKLAIFNLLDNARKYSEPDSPIELECHLEGNEAVISIRNRGIPMTKQDAELFFEKFRRGSNARNTGGAGLGLWLVKSIIDQLDGKITLKGIPSGVEATLRLPLFHHAG